MLYDPKWDAIYTTENFERWLAKEPPRKGYRYVDPANCAIAQYLKAHNVAGFMMMPDRIEELGWQHIVMDGRETFGAAAKRARWVLRRQRVREFFGAIFAC